LYCALSQMKAASSQLTKNLDFFTSMNYLLCVLNQLWSRHPASVVLALWMITHKLDGVILNSLQIVSVS
jgi:hypothetical protein